jgi:hypothetical protein
MEENRAKRLPECAASAYQMLRLCRWLRSEARALKVEIPKPPRMPKPPKKAKRAKRRKLNVRRALKRLVADDDGGEGDVARKGAA